jgi:hypothetical protein
VVNIERQGEKCARPKIAQKFVSQKIAGARKKFRRKNPMICPFCKKTIHIEFYNGRWVAMRDGYEHSCIGLVKALANADASEKSAGGHFGTAA